MNDDHYFVEVRHRPRRVAFFVDVDQTSETLFDEIVEFNVSSWGGRYNPIIPVLSGNVTEPYWQLLRLVNPDILYTYCDLPIGVLRRILTDIRPLDVLRHDQSLQSRDNDFRVKIGWRHGHYLRLISYDETIEHMRDVTKRICEDLKWGNLHPAEPIMAFEPRSVGGLFTPHSAQPRSKQVSGSRSFLELSPPQDAPHDSDERWIAEFAVESSGQERYFANKTAWWKLPQKNGIASLFVPQSSCRVGNDYLISVDVSGQQQGVMLNTPDLKSLFATLVLPQAPPAWAQRLDPTLRGAPGNTLYIRSSDKGMYARGILGLFESLQKAAYVFEHAFWRGVIESLSSPVASEHTRNKVRNNLEGIGLDALNSASGIDLLVDEVLDAAGRIQRPIHYTNFSPLFAGYWTYVKALSKEEQINEVTQSNPSQSEFSNEKDIRDSARRNLRNMMSEMTARKVFLHGVPIAVNKRAIRNMKAGAIGKNRARWNRNPDPGPEVPTLARSHLFTSKSTKTP